MKPSKRPKTAVSAPRPSDVKPYPRPPSGAAVAPITREAKAEYSKAWKRLIGKPEAKGPS